MTQHLRSKTYSSGPNIQTSSFHDRSLRTDRRWVDLTGPESLCNDLNQFSPRGLHDGFQPVSRVELLIGVMQMVSQRARRDSEFFRNLRRGLAFCKQFEHS